MYNKFYSIGAIAIIILATLTPKYFNHNGIVGRILETKLLEKVEQVPVKRVTINEDNASVTVNTNKNFTRYRIYIKYQYYVDNKRYIGEHKFGDYPGYLTELELINVKRKYFKGATIPIFVHNLKHDSSRITPPPNYLRIYLASIGFAVLYLQIFAILFKLRDKLIGEGKLNPRPY